MPTPLRFAKLMSCEYDLADYLELGPALVLVINPIIAYTAFEQLKNYIIARRFNTAKLRPVSSGITAKPAITPLSDLDNFLLGAVSGNRV